MKLFSFIKVYVISLCNSYGLLILDIIRIGLRCIGRLVGIRSVNVRNDGWIIFI